MPSSATIVSTSGVRRCSRTARRGPVVAKSLLFVTLSRDIQPALWNDIAPNRNGYNQPTIIDFL
jgi:hypothetical protein